MESDSTRLERGEFRGRNPYLLLRLRPAARPRTFFALPFALPFVLRGRPTFKPQRPAREFLEAGDERRATGRAACGMTKAARAAEKARRDEYCVPGTPSMAVKA